MKPSTLALTILVTSTSPKGASTFNILSRFTRTISGSTFANAAAANTPSPSFPQTSTKHLTTMSSLSEKDTLLNCPTIPLHDGTPHPSIGFGTYKVGFIPASASSAVAAGGAGGVERTAEECVSDAIDCGYRFLECAEFYGNEAEVGKAIAKSGIAREEFFLCSKVWTTTIEKGPEAIRAQLEKTLIDLGTDYLDLYLIHWPVPGKHVEGYKVRFKNNCEYLICRFYR